jgi:glycosyltransferase involved in cell wall biosynthesis
MDAPALRIALVSPHAFPPGDDVGRAVRAEAEALARRGHAVTILAPGTGRTAVDDGRRRIDALEAGDADAVAAIPGGEPLFVATSRAIRRNSTSGRRLGGPIDAASGLEIALGMGGFDVAHLHEPLAPSPALAALRHATGVRAVTFHRTAPLAGVAFVRPLVDRALGQADLRIAGSDAARHVLEGVLPGTYDVVPPGVEPGLFGPPSDGPGVVIIARERERTGLRFALRALATLDPHTIGRITVIGPSDAPWRTRNAVPKALRDVVDVVPDTGPVARADAMRHGRIAVLPTVDDAASPALGEAMAAGMAIVAPRCAEADDALGADAGVVVPPFSAEAVADAVRMLAGSPDRATGMGALARSQRGSRSWDDVAADLEALYRGVAGREHQPATPALVFADLRVRTGPGLSATEVVAAAVGRDVRVIAVAAPGGIAPALAVLQAASDGLHVIVGQEIATREGVVVGLFLTAAVPDGLALADALRRVRDQGGVTLVPHPDDGGAPMPEALRECRALIDCHEGITPARPAAQATEAALLLQRAGLVITGGSAATRPEDIGTAGMVMRPFAGPADFLTALGDARPARRRRGLRARTPRSSRRASQP